MADDEIPSWEDVARDYGRFLYTLAYRFTGNDFDAHDLTQEVLMRVRRGLETYKPGSMEGWLTRITTNTFFDLVRRKKRRPEHPMDEKTEASLTTIDVSDELLSQQFSSELQDALTDMPEEFRVAVVLSDVMGMSYQEIGDALEVPIGTVRSRIHRGRLMLRKALV
jgi:RNA polymerase sigma factor (sigma-70 family)